MAKKKTAVKSSRAAAEPHTGCAAGVCDPERTQGLKAPAPVGTHDLVTLNGPGVFLGAAISKQGGTNDLTFVILDIDGRNVVNLSYAGATNEGLTQQNPYGLVLLHSAPQDDDPGVSDAAAVQAKLEPARHGQRAGRRPDSRKRGARWRLA